LLEVVVLAGAHVTSQREVERSVGEVAPAHHLELGQSVQHPEIHVVGIEVGDVLLALPAIGQFGRDFGDFEIDGLADPIGVFKGNDVRHWCS
jgi:hypothetical protein